MAMGTFLVFVSGVFFFELDESIEKVEFVRAKLTLEFVTVEPLDRDFNLFFESVEVLFNKAFDFEDNDETLEICRRLRGASAEVLMISRPRDDIATVTLSDFCSDFDPAFLEVEA